MATYFQARMPPQLPGFRAWLPTNRLPSEQRVRTGRWHTKFISHPMVLTASEPKKCSALRRAAVRFGAGRCEGAKKTSRPQEKGTSPNSLRVTGLCDTVLDDAKRRARESNPQPVTRHLISSQAANHSRTLRMEYW